MPALLILLVVFLACAAPAQARDVAVTGFGDPAGYHVMTATRAGDRVVWRELAVLAPGGQAERSWTGGQCVSADGRYAAVVVLPISAADSPPLLAHGATAYAVDLRDGGVRVLSSSVAAGYDTPGCGAGHRAAFRSSPDTDGRRTRILLARLDRPQARWIERQGQLTSPVPLGNGFVAARGNALAGTAVRVPGTIYDLRAGRHGALWFLSSAFGRERAALWRLRDGHLRQVATGPRVGTALRGAGRTLTTFGLRAAGLEHAAGAGVLSSGGTFTVTEARGAFETRTGRRLAGETRGGPGRLVTERAESAHARVASAGSPVCAVPRLDPARQVLQPDSRQIGWATQLAARGLLTGANQRPAGFANLGLEAYAPNGDFPRIALAHPGGDSWDTVPRSVMEAILAQESNFNQASWHALPGIAGDPLVADPYGGGGNSLDHIDYAKADCGYGVAQVTDGMRLGQLAPDLQAKIAVDYAENVAAGLSILERAWNQLYAAGIVANGGNPRYLENWYFAVWAYNTGIQPNAAHGNVTGCTPGPNCTGPAGTWGLGWANNPANPAYPPNRTRYLQTTYADAAHPGDWPYQERIMGWMASPLLGYDGKPRYAGPDYHGTGFWLNVPPASLFCSPEANRCNGAGLGSPGTCALADDTCWLHAPVTWVDCARNCATSAYDVSATATEPAVTNPHPPTCLPRLDDGAIVVDDLPAPGLNLVSCANRAWTTQGTFTYTYARNADGDPVGMIDTHQLGAGFGGHVLFTHTEPPGRLINTGTWRPDLPGAQYYDVEVHVPATGAEITDAAYVLDSAGYGDPVRVTINQAQEAEAWTALGRFALGPGATVTLTNASAMTPERYDVAFDAVAFIPRGGTPPHQGEPSTTTPIEVAPPAGSAGAQQPPPRTAGTPARCDPGSDSRFWNVFKVTLTCIGSGQVFKDPELAPGAKCIVMTGIEYLPLTRIAKVETAVGGFRTAAKDLRKELKAIDASFPRKLGAGLEGLGKANDLLTQPGWTTLQSVVASRLVLIGVRQTLTKRKGDYSRAFKLLKTTQDTGKVLLDLVVPFGDTYECVKTVRGS